MMKLRVAHSGASPTEASLLAEWRDLGRLYFEPRSLDFTRNLIPFGMTAVRGEVVPLGMSGGDW